MQQDALTATATSELRQAVKSAVGANGKASKALTVAFVALLAADAEHDAKSVSKALAEAIESLSDASLASVRSHNRKYFEQSEHVAAVRATVPASLDPVQFHAACVAFASKLNVRAWYDQRAKDEKAAKASLIKAAEEARRTSAVAEAGTIADAPAPAPVDYVTKAHLGALAMIETLRAAMGDPATRDAAIGALAEVAEAAAEATMVELREAVSVAA